MITATPLLESRETHVPIVNGMGFLQQPLNPVWTQNETLLLYSLYHWHLVHRNLCNYSHCIDKKCANGTINLTTTATL